MSKLNSLVTYNNGKMQIVNIHGCLCAAELNIGRWVKNSNMARALERLFTPIKHSFWNDWKCL